MFKTSKIGLRMMALGTAAVMMAAVAVLVPLRAEPAKAASMDILWQQLGADIDGERIDDRSGWSVAMSADGTTVIVGAITNDGNGSAAGHARIFSWDGMRWVQRGSDIDGENSRDTFGSSVAMSADGTTVIVASAQNSDAGRYSGHARIFRWDGSGWGQLGADIDGENPADYFGSSVAMSADGDTVIIGAPGSDGNGVGAGHARIFRWDGTGWGQLGADIDGENRYDGSGWSVAMSADGDTVIIGAPSNNGSGDVAGHARIFRWDGTGWGQRGTDIDGENRNDLSGNPVAMSADGDTVIIGALGNSDNGESAGHARIFRWDGSGWGQLGADIDGENPFDRSSESLAMSADGDTVIIGTSWNSDTGRFRGHARIFQWDGSGWDQLGAGIDGENHEERSGTSVAMSADGGTVIIGAPRHGNGHARVYRQTDTFYLCEGVPVTINMVLGDSGVGTAGNDVILGTAGDDVIRGLGGNDRICAGAGNDIVNGGSGKDRIWGGPGSDTIHGQQGNDRIWAGPGADVVFGDNGADRVWAGAGNDNVRGGDGDDLLVGDDGDDVLEGRVGNDTLVGRAGNDTLAGGAGIDTCNGNTDTDVATDCETKLNIP